MTTKQVALVTGASSGIGRAIAERLAAEGHAVFGTSRDPARAGRSDRVKLLPLDVTNPAEPETTVRAVLEEAGRLDVLVNNAGTALMGAVEEVELTDARRQFDTNFFGVLNVTRAALPAMRRQRAGLVVNIGSVAGLLAMPFAGLYSASKFALEGLTEALRHEVAPLGIRVVLVEPGFFRSNLVSSAVIGGQSIPDYQPARARVLGRIREIERAASPPDAVAELIARLVATPRPALRHPVGKEKIYAALKRFLPEALFEPRGRKYWRVTV